MHFVQSEETSSHLTQNDYEDFMICNQINEAAYEQELMKWDIMLWGQGKQG